ncbi:cancer/testis antigen 1-like isoform X4 [Felis catus]|nr:cancer/testis antigen 1-like isoform X4 [Felis catus]XP_044906831.1 cancer/testis antigen 1-like isoform X4 [Felis catus]XP_044906841.1 cancer/testis antigen 1-like isoform X4 [Felis catus]
MAPEATRAPAVEVVRERSVPRPVRPRGSRRRHVLPSRAQLPCQGLADTLCRDPVGTAGPQPEGRGASRCSSTSYVTMPFPSPTEAQVAHQCLATQGQPQVGAVRKEFTVLGNVLIIRLTAEDPGQLQVSIASCLDQLSLLVWTMQRFVPPFFTLPEPGKRG